MGNNISIDSEVVRSVNVIGIIFLAISILPLWGFFFATNNTDLVIVIVLFCVFMLIALLMITYKAKIIIAHNEYSVKHTTLGMDITNRTDITGWKTIRLSARTHHSSGNTFSPRKFELDLSPSVGKEWTFGDVFISGHFQYAFDEDPAVVAGMLIKLQKVTGFNVELDKSAEALFGVTYRTLKTEARV
ncbi:MAG: hypothetical protein V7765_04800 [Oleispira sp.]